MTISINYSLLFTSKVCKPNINNGICPISYLSVRKQLDKYSLIDYSFIEPPLFEENYMDVRIKVGHIKRQTGEFPIQAHFTGFNMLL